MRFDLIDRLRDYPPATAIWPLRRLLVAGVVLGAVGFLAPMLLAIKLTIEPNVVRTQPVEALLSRFGQHGYDLSAVLAGTSAAPRMFVAALPGDWPDLAEADVRKRAFVMVVLPLVLRANEEILSDRAQLKKLVRQLSAGDDLSRRDRRWLARLALEYDLEANSILSGSPSKATLKTLMRRVDIVPPSLAIAQAAVESGWGTSRFALDGRALYGQWAEQADGGLVPADRDDGRTYVIKHFSSLSESVAAYMKNLNTHRAYREFRAVRVALRRDKEPIQGLALAPHVRSYSARGVKYVDILKAIIGDNDLDALDRARLERA